MAKERIRGHDVGATGRTVAQNIQRARKSQQISLQELERRLADAGRKISFSGLSKIERADRRVDVDDLMAIAIALDLSPLGLLLPVDQEPDKTVDVTGASGSLAIFWEWALAADTHFSRDVRAFIARSLPWWLTPGHADIEWQDELILSLGRLGRDPEEVASIKFSARATEGADQRDPHDRDSDNGKRQAAT